MINVIADRIIKAIHATPRNYLAETLARHNPPQLIGHVDHGPLGAFGAVPAAQAKPRQVGSRFAARQTEATLIAFAAFAKEFTPPDGVGVEGCHYYKLPIDGLVRMVALADIPQDWRVLLTDPKRTVGTNGGGVSAEITDAIMVCANPEIGLVSRTSTLIIGPDNGAEVVYTVHPGEPIARPAAANDPKLVGQRVTVAEARKLGLTHALFS